MFRFESLVLCSAERLSPEGGQMNIGSVQFGSCSSQIAQEQMMYGLRWDFIHAEDFLRLLFWKPCWNSCAVGVSNAAHLIPLVLCRCGVY